MRIRTLVPALACLAAAPIYAADSDPSVKLDGFVDTILSGTSVVDSDPETQESNTAFSYAAKLGVAATISDKVSAQIDAFISGSSVAGGDYDGDSEADGSSDQITIRQAYGIWKIAPDVELKTGKFISNYGWIAAYAPGLYRINTGPIVAFYGVDQVGADVKYTKDDLTACLTLANGFFGEDYNDAAQSGSDQKDQAMALGVDVNYAFGDKGSFNAELVYDMDTNPTGGDGLHFGLNATMTPNEQITAGAELIWQSVAAVDDAAAGSDEDQEHLGFMAMVNFKLGSALPVPASVTAMLQYIDKSGVDNTPDNDESEMEFAVALLTNPAGTDKLGANFEIYYDASETDDGTTETEETEVGVAAELLYVF